MRALIICSIIAVALTALLPAQALKDAASGMLAFVGLLIAMLIPTMALNVTALRPRGHRKNAERTGTALMTQFEYWAAMLWLSLALAGLLIAGSVLQWNDWAAHYSTRFGTITLRPITILNASIWFCAALLAAKLGGFVNGFRSLLKLHINQVLDDGPRPEAKDKERRTAIEQSPPDPNFGKLIDE